MIVPIGRESRGAKEHVMMKVERLVGPGLRIDRFHAESGQADTTVRFAVF